ncbi:MAG: carboxypeptidase regulatory-like domain-containing protein [Candidatus Sericytochromatia bacterium]|nr:carboxypeptidase regulatory-like domain-containing protein [Candidatus Sericytochromatia bacterium]
MRLLPILPIASLVAATLTATGCGRVSPAQPARPAPALSKATRNAPTVPGQAAAPSTGARLPAVAMVAAGVGTARGLVLRQDNKQPVAGATVVAEPGGQRAVTDATGTFNFSGLAGGNYTFKAMSQGLSQATPAGSLVMPGEAAEVPALMMVPGLGPTGITSVSYVLDKELGRLGEPPATLLAPVGVAARGAAVLVLDRNAAAFVKTGVIRQYDAEAATFQGKFGDYSKWLGFAQMKDTVTALALDAQGRAVVLDGGKTLWRFDANGQKNKQTELSTDAVDVALDGQGQLLVAGPSGLTRLGPDGDGGQALGALADCRAVAAGRDAIWVVTGQKVARVTLDGTVALEFGAGGMDSQEAFSEPVDVAVDPRNGHVVVVDKGKQAVTVYDPMGTLIGKVGAGVFEKPVAVTVDAGGRLYVVDQAKKKVYKFLPGVAR